MNTDLVQALCFLKIIEDSQDDVCIIKTETINAIKSILTVLDSSEDFEHIIDKYQDFIENIQMLTDTNIDAVNRYNRIWQKFEDMQKTRTKSNIVYDTNRYDLQMKLNF